MFQQFVEGLVAVQDRYLHPVYGKSRYSLYLKEFYIGSITENWEGRWSGGFNGCYFGGFKSVVILSVPRSYQVINRLLESVAGYKDVFLSIEEIEKREGLPALEDIRYRIDEMIQSDFSIVSQRQVFPWSNVCVI